MNKLDTVKIEKFWGDKEVVLKLKEDVNFLIGVNGSGKTQIINLIAATLKADFSTLDRFQFKKIHITLKPIILDSKTKKSSFIEVEKTERQTSPYPNIVFKIKRYEDSEPKKYLLDELEEEHMIRHWEHTSAGYITRRNIRGRQIEKDVNAALENLVDVSWLSIHRAVFTRKRGEERSIESSIDLKVEELQIELVKYFSQLNQKSTLESEEFQKYIFESLIETTEEKSLSEIHSAIDAEKEKNALKQIFLHFKLPQKTVERLDIYFKAYNLSASKLDGAGSIFVTDLAYLLGTQKIHSVVQEWSKVIEKQKNINKSKEVFLQVINKLLQRKELFINDKNELTVRTQNGKSFPLTELSSGEKQLLIILGQTLLQEEKVHIYIADEPELSLHVEWQEKLVKSLKSVNPNSQIIFATHSPDIVGEYDSSVIKVEEAIK